MRSLIPKYLFSTLYYAREVLEELVIKSLKGTNL
jgi:hypothetical protein